MCMEVEVDGKVCASQGELSKALGGPLVMDYGPQDNRLCLCPVHVGNTAAHYGRKIESSDNDPWCVKMTPNDRSEPTARLFAQVGSTDGLCPAGHDDGKN